MICSIAFGMTGAPFASVPLPETANMQCWLVAMILSTLMGVALPTLRWYLCNGIDSQANSQEEEHVLNFKPEAPWDIAQISFIGCSAVSVLWIVLAQVAALIE